MIPMLVIIKRDIQHTLIQKMRFVSTMVRPLLWLFVIGAGIKSMATGFEQSSYQHFMVPGILSMLLLFSGVLSALSLLKERYSGFLRLLLVAPISRAQIIWSKLLSSIITSIVYFLIFFTLCLCAQLVITELNIFVLMLVVILSALLWSGLGLLIAVVTPDLENFTIVMNFIVFPLFFLSNALYPLSQLPKVFYYLALCNPLTYCVDGLYHALGLHEFSHFALWQDLTAIMICIVLVVSTTLIKFRNHNFYEL